VAGSTLTCTRWSTPLRLNCTVPLDSCETECGRADADVVARAVLRATLTDQDVAGEHALAAELLQAQSLAL